MAVLENTLLEGKKIIDRGTSDASHLSFDGLQNHGGVLQACARGSTRSACAGELAG